MNEGLRQLARSHDTTLFTVLLAAYQVLLYRYSGQHDLLVGTPAACREQQEFEHLVGYVANMVVLRGDLSGSPSFSKFLWQTRDTVLRCLEHKEYPFSLLVERLRPDRTNSRSPLFQAALLMERSHRRWRLAPPLP